ncbi:hypothetical protein ACQP2P_34865 [Dactylosporangium sp. CA-139114]|uniref:hypothetical protein n=1 Tax=Dactylosporangium sp. CA-139114 TaxID=3239931 RepID=UPI003D989F4E
MAERGSKEEPAHESPEPIESLIDDAIREILEEAGTPGAAHARSTAPLLDAMVSTTRARGGQRGSVIERVLLAEALAGALADALAPALAAVLAPRIVDMLEGGGQDAEPPHREQAAAGRTRKSDSK